MSLEKLVESSWKFYRRCIFREGSLRYFLEDFWIWSQDSERIYCQGVRFPSGLVNATVTGFAVNATSPHSSKGPV